VNLGLVVLALVLPLKAADISFNRDIRPIMSDTCFRCHGPDASSRMAGLRLDIRDEALKTTKSGVTPIVPGDPAKSAIVDRIFTTSKARLMPPAFAHKELTDEQKATIREWVVQGARYEGHWAYQPVRPPEIPAGASHPVDAFVRSRLKREGLSPSPPADKRTLLRRVSLDLTGLPPSQAEVEAFLADSSPGAYEKVVDRLLVSPRFAEKQTMHWLDAVRYADTCGFHGDNPIPAWPYRDYVLRSFLNNKPFDQFTIEQIAGDLLPNPTAEQKVATAYHRLTRTSAEGGIQAKEYLAKYQADRVRTLSAAWLGSTMGCAECHDHKFDPFTAKDFYSMKAFFADIDEEGFVFDRGPKAWGVQLRLADGAQLRELEVLKARYEEILCEIEDRAAKLSETGLLDRFESGEFSWKLQRPLKAESANGATLTIYNEEQVDSLYEYRGSIVGEKRTGNGLIVASGSNPDNDAFTVTFRPGPGLWRALAIEAVQDDTNSGLRYARGADRFVMSSVSVQTNGRDVPLALATANTDNLSVLNDTPPMAALDGNAATGWGVSMHGGANVVLALRFAEPLRIAGGEEVVLKMRFDSAYRRAVIGRLRIAMSEAVYSWPGRNAIGMHEETERPNGVPETVVKALRVSPDKRDADERKAILHFLAFLSPDTQPLLIEAAKLDAKIGLMDAAIPRVVITRAKPVPDVTRILPRGNWMDDSGEIVEPSVPTFLGGWEVEGSRATRLDLAKWLVSESNPLTARVFVNRTWRQFFGTGLSKVLDDFGSQGEAPSHPELLDWLAAGFMDGWDVKRTIRTIVTSETYQQSSVPTDEQLQKDPDNRLLARQSRPRVDAETVRDVALATSGLLVERLGGPSVRPPQPEGYLAALNYPRREYSASRGEDQYRRGVYTFWQRTFLQPSLAAFDAPSREECTMNRSSSNTPLQALVLLNDPVYVEASRVFARNAVAQGGRSTRARVTWVVERATGQPPAPEVRQTLEKLYQDALAEFRKNPQSAKELLAVGEAEAPTRANPAELAAMTVVARAALNLHETITRN
jgi:hypothetical protein